MKFSTTTMYLVIWLLPLFADAQTDIGTPLIPAVGEGDLMEVVLSKEYLQKLKKECSEISLELISVRLELAGQQHEHSPKYERLSEIEQKLTAAFASRNEFMELLESTEYWPIIKRKKVIEKWLNKNATRNKEVVTKTRMDEPVPHFGARRYYQFSTADDLLAQPPGHICDNGQEKGRKTKSRTNVEVLFGHTDRHLEQHFIKREFVSGLASLRATNNGITILDLTLAVATPRANDIFGVIKPGATISIQLLDGTVINLINQKGTKGEWNVNMQSYLYHCSYLIGGKEEKILKSQEVDKVTIRWHKVQDQYEIFELDFFINHFYCLENV
ncbi:MAG: hypothetical protein AAFZ15_06310 [Bacteroidota bacterium]